jgi:hypothetical protein
MLDAEKRERRRATDSLAFQVDKDKRAAVQVIGVRGNEAIRVVGLGVLRRRPRNLSNSCT